MWAARVEVTVQIFLVLPWLITRYRYVTGACVCLSVSVVLCEKSVHIRAVNRKKRAKRWCLVRMVIMQSSLCLARVWAKDKWLDNCRIYPSSLSFFQFVGAPCGHHGNYTFYKAFKYTLHGNQKILSLGEFFFIKIWEDEEIISIGEAQLLWEDRTSGQILVSLRIYFLPENTPEGRCEEHGEVSNIIPPLQPGGEHLGR